MRFAILFALAGCRQLLGFDEPRAIEPGSDGPVDTSTATDTSVDMPPGSLCGTSLARRVVCFTFDGDTLDRSGNGNDANATGFTFVPGVSGQAVDTTLADIQIPDDPSLDVTSLTIRMQVNPTKHPDAGARFGLYDNTRYRMHVRDDGFVRCAINNGAPEVFSGEALPLDMFTRVTCTYDGLSLRIYFNGVQKAAINSAVVIGTINGVSTLGHSHPTGENFPGVIDDLEIFDGIVAP